MYFLLYCTPLILFVLIFVGSGIYFTIHGVSNAFYQLSPITALLPSLALAWILHKGKTNEKMNAFLEGVRHKDIITMCMIFLLAGAFCEITKAIGSIDATVHCALTFIPSHFLLVGIFIATALIATAIGTSMGAIAAITPLAAHLCTQAELPLALGVATVVGGAMFGDNLSLVSDTTIAAVMSQEADMKAKFKLNALVATLASTFTLLLLFLIKTEGTPLTAHDYSFILITPYILLIALALMGINIFVGLIASIAFAGMIGFLCDHAHGILFFSRAITQGFANMHEIMVLSLLVGGLSGLSGKSSQKLAEQLLTWMSGKQRSRKFAQFVIAGLVSILDLLFANNTVAIIFSGTIAQSIAKKHHVPPHYSAAWLDIFSCVFQGLIPYGAQVLLASSIAGVSPLAVSIQVYYCMFLGIVSILFISVQKNRHMES